MSHNGDQSAAKISVWEDLKRRNVYRAGVGYAAFAWLIIQASEIVFPRLGFPDWSITLAIVVILAGFPVALLLGWIFQITPEGLVFDRPRDVRWSTYFVFDAVIVLALVTAGTVYWYRIHQNADVVVGPPTNSIAVLPFTVIGKDPDTSAIAVGMADELLTNLSQLEELTVSSRIAAEYFAGLQMPLREVASNLDVRYVVEGSVQKEGDRVRVTIQLIDAQKNDHLWADNYDEMLTGLLSLRSRIAADIIEGLKLRLSLSSARKLQAEPTDSGDAFVLYLKAKEFLNSPRDPDNLAQAETFLLNAIELDPRFASAYAGLCQTYLGSFTMERDSALFERAEKFCHRSMTLHDGQIDTYVALGELYSTAGKDDEALQYFDAALKLNANAAEAMMKKGLALDKAGRVTDAETSLRQAVKSEPYYWRAQNSLGMFLMRHARYEDAAEVFGAVTTLTPSRQVAFNNLAAALYMSGDQDGAIAAFEASIAIQPGRAALVNTANLYYYRGEFDKAAQRYSQAAAMVPKDDRPLGGLAASVRFVAGRESEAKPLFERAAGLVEELLAISPDDRLAWARLANYRAYTGDRDGALAALERADPFRADDLEVLFYACLTYVELGREQDAIESMEILATRGYTRSILENDPDLAAIRSDNRVIAVLSVPQ